MSIATKIAAITGHRNQIRNKLVSMGIATGTDDLEALATKIEAIVDRGAVEAEVQEGETYTIPAGYHNGSGTVSGIAGGGNYTLQAKTVTPTKTQQTITPDEGKYGLASVTVGAIPDAYQDVTAVTAEAGDVLAGKEIIGADGTAIVGTIANNGALALTIDGMVTDSVAIPAGYTTGGTCTLTSSIEDALALI